MTVTSKATCEDLDASDPLAVQRSMFSLPEATLYLDGNSLGALPRSTAAKLDKVITEQWGAGLISSWEGHGWWAKPLELGDRLAPLIGAAPGEVVVGDSTSINLFKVLAAALGLRPGRRVVVADARHFPSDGYVIEGLCALLPGCQVRTVEGDDRRLAEAIDDSVAAVVADHVDYRYSTVRDMSEVTSRAHSRGALAIWDLSHSAGAIAVALDRDEVDFAVGCTYKYLNGGPGAPAFLFAAQRHLETARQPLSGWSGHADPFGFSAGYKPAPGVARFLCSTPAILSLAAVEASLDIWDSVDLAAVVDKGARLGDLMIELVEARFPDGAMTLASPRRASERGNHVAFRHPRAAELIARLAARSVIADFRPPDILRFGMAPLYLRYVDIWDSVEVLSEVLGAVD
jgi:kynureninase